MPDKPVQEPTPDQHEALHAIIDRLPRWSDQFTDHSDCQQTIASLRSMLESQGLVSDQHRERVQELAAENQRFRKALEEALFFLRETVPDPCACWGASECDLHEMIANLEEVIPD